MCPTFSVILYLPSKIVCLYKESNINVLEIANMTFFRMNLSSFKMLTTTVSKIAVEEILNTPALFATLSCFPHTTSPSTFAPTTTHRRRTWSLLEKAAFAESAGRCSAQPVRLIGTSLSTQAKEPSSARSAASRSQLAEICAGT